MPRRAGLPPEIREELPQRAAAGHGLDNDHPTEVGGTKVPAARALTGEPSREMDALVRQVTAFLTDRGAQHIAVVADRLRTGATSQLTVLWTGAVSPHVVAEAFAVSHAEDGTPRIPAWLNLRHDGEFDMRWQPPF